MLTAFFYLILFFWGAAKSLSGKPLYGIYIYFLSFYMHAPTQWWGAYLPDLRWSMLSAAITFFSLILYKKSEWKFWTFRENKLLLLLFILVLLQWPFTVNPSFHSEYVFLLLKFIFFIVVLQNAIESTDDIKKIIIVNLLGGAYLAYVGISTHSGGRLGGIGTAGMDGANQLGQHFTVLLFMGAYLLLTTWTKMHAIIGACVALILMAIFLTESRGVIVSLFATGVVGAILIPKGTGSKWAGFAVVALFSSALLMGPQIIERFEGMNKDASTGEMEDASAQSRWVIVDAQLAMSKAAPFIGHGHRGTLVLSPSYIQEEYLSQNVGLRASHNVAMSFLVDHGWIGFALYFSAIFSAGWRAWSVKTSLSPSNIIAYQEHLLLRCMLVGCALAMVSFMVGGMFSNNKKLEADIWLIALIPVIHYRIMALALAEKCRDTLSDKDSSCSFTEEVLVAPESGKPMC